MTFNAIAVAVIWFGLAAFLAWVAGMLFRGETREGEYEDDE